MFTPPSILDINVRDYLMKECLKSLIQNAEVIDRIQHFSKTDL